MALVKCPNCGASLRVGDELTGKKVRCSRCSNVLVAPGAPADPRAMETGRARPLPPALPAAEDEMGDVTAVEDEEPENDAGSDRPRWVKCPACGERNSPQVRRCRNCKEFLGDEEVPSGRRRKRPPATFRPCPRCGAKGATRVTWTFWGSFYGPALFNHVRCPQCGHAYNGRTGGSNLVPAVVFVTVPALLIAGLVAVVVWIIKQRTGG